MTIRLSPRDQAKDHDRPEGPILQPRRPKARRTQDRPAPRPDRRHPCRPAGATQFGKVIILLDRDECKPIAICQHPIIEYSDIHDFITGARMFS